MRYIIRSRWIKPSYRTIFYIEDTETGKSYGTFYQRSDAQAEVDRLNQEGG